MAVAVGGAGAGLVLSRQEREEGAPGAASTDWR